MAFRLVRNDITKMKTDIIVNTANTLPIVGPGCDKAIYEAAGFDKLLEARREIGEIAVGEVAITPAFDLNAKYIIHAVSPLFEGGDKGEEKLLRNCYKNSLMLAYEYGASSISFPLISTGSFGYPKEEGLRIALDEICAFLLDHKMEVYVVVFDETSSYIGAKVYPDLEAYIDRHYVEEKTKNEYMFQAIVPAARPTGAARGGIKDNTKDKPERNGLFSSLVSGRERKGSKKDSYAEPIMFQSSKPKDADEDRTECYSECSPFFFDEEYEKKLNERMKHISDSFSQYLLYLISKRGMKNSDVYKAALVNKKTFSKIKNNPKYHPNKMTAMCLCVGARLNLDETRDLMARAGYALSPCDKTDIIFSFFIENQVYDIFEIDIQLEEHGLPPLVDEDIDYFSDLDSMPDDEI